MKSTSVCFVLVLGVGVGCQRAPSEPPRAVAPSPSAPSAPTPMSTPLPPLPFGHGDPHAGMTGPSAGGAMPTITPAGTTLAWDDPPTWQRVPPASPMRRAQLRIPHVAGDEVDAELVVITFGPGQGGDTESNLQRWYGQVTQPDGRPTAQLATRSTLTVGSLNVTVTEVAGRLGGAGGMMPGMPAAAPIEHGRLLAAIVDAPSGAWFFKITGPDATVSAARPAFETMLRTVRSVPSTPGGT